MLSNKVIDYLNKQGVYSEKEDKAYKKALIDLGIDLNSDFALFNLNTTEITFRGQCGQSDPYSCQHLYCLSNSCCLQ